MRICFLCDEYPPGRRVGGLGSFVRDVGRELVRIGNEVIVAGIYPREEAGLGNDGGVTVVRLPGAFRGRLGFIRDRLILGRWVAARARSFDVLEAAEGGGWGLFVPRSLPAVVRFHSSVRYGECMGWRGPRGRLLRVTEELAIRRANGLVAVSRWVAQRAPDDYRWAGLRSRRIRVIHNGVDLSLFCPKPWGDRVRGRVVFAGTIKPQKGLVTLLKAFSIVANSNREAHLIVAGRDTLYRGRSYWEAAIEEARVGGSIIERIQRMNALSRESLAELYGSAAVCVFPSLAESFGLVAAEAMACGRPVVYSSTTAGPEVIRHGVDGFLADPADPQAVAQAIVRVLENEGLAARIADQAARSARDRFSICRCAAETLDYYRTLLARGGAERRARDD